MKFQKTIFLSILLISIPAFATKEFSRSREYSVIKLDIQGVEKISENFYVGWIEVDPKMPQLKLELLPENMEGKINWTFTILYYQIIRRTVSGVSNIYSISNKTIFTKSITLDADQQWDVGKEFESNFYGGDAKITLEYIDKNNMAQPKQEFYISIRGKNPSLSQVINYVGNNPWFAKAMAKRESGGEYHQFSTWPTRVLGPSRPDIPTEEVILNELYLPNASFDKGFGIFQLTDPAPTINQIWSWKANVDEAMSRINGFLKVAKKRIEYARSLANKDLEKKRIDAIPEIPSKTYGNVTLKDPWVYPTYDKTFTHAIAMRRYNGIATPDEGKHDFVEWVNRDWKFYYINNYNSNYVKEICNNY